MIPKHRTPALLAAGLAILLAALAAPLLPGPARAAEEVNVYSYRQPFLIKPLFDAFTRETGIRVNVVFAPKGMVERIRQEGRNSPADMIFTVDIGRLQDAVEAEILQPVRTPALERNVPAPYRHPDGQWYALTLRSRVVFASRERVRPGELETYEELATPEWKGRICMRSSQHDYNIGLLASLIVHHGAAEAEAWARGLKENLARKPQGNDRAQVRAIKEGECDVALVNTYYLGAMLQDAEQAQWADSVFMIFPNQQGRGAHVNISGAGVARHAPHKANAVRLLEFLSGDLAQRLYAEQNFEYPVRPGTPWSGLLESWGHFKMDAVALQQIAQHRAEAIRIFDRAGVP
jgi:iron(III) transport system substrate-binding protein